MDEYWDGATWAYQAEIVNAAAAGNHTYDISSGEGSEFEIIGGQLLQGDTVSRTAHIRIDDGTTTIIDIFPSTSTAAGTLIKFPSTLANDARILVARPWIVSGTLRLIATVESVGANDDSTLGLICRIRGSVPTATETGGAGATVNNNVERVF